MNPRGALAAAALVFALALPARAEPAPGAWEQVLPFKPGGASAQTGVDAQGTAYLLRGGVLRFWASGAFHETQGAPDLRRGARLLGGPDRGLFLAMDGKVYSLSRRGLTPVADYYKPAGVGSVHVTTDGRLMQWGSRFITPDLARPDERLEAPLDPRRTKVLDDGPRVHLVCRDRIYTVGPDGSIVQKTLELPTPPQEESVWLVPFGPGKALALWSDRLQTGVDLRTGRPFSVQPLMDVVAGGSDPVFVLGMADGSCVAWARGKEGPLYRVPPGGEPRELPGSAAIPGHFRGSMLWDEANGSLWLNGGAWGLMRFADGAAHTWGWREGLRIGDYQHVLMDGAGDVFSIGAYGVSIFRPDGTPPEPPPGYTLWKQVFADYPPQPDFHGGVWVLREDAPESVSHWDGHDWADVEVPFRGQAVTLIPDDRGHLLAAIWGEDKPCYDVSLEGARLYDSVEDAVLAAVRDGARRFGGETVLFGVVTDGGRIWVSERFPGRLHYYDGTQWRVEPPPPAYFPCRSSAHGVLFLPSPDDSVYFWPEVATDGHTQYVWARGGELMLGPVGLQPFEKELLDARPDLYMSLKQVKDPILLPEGPTGGSGGWPRWTWPGLDGGLWLTNGVEDPARVFAGRVYHSDFSGTPLRPKARGAGIFEDAAHNLWIVGAGYFMVRMADFRVRLGEAPAKVGGTLKVKASLDRPGLAPGQGRVFWRVDDSPWQGGDPPGLVTVPFTTVGRHRVEFLGMGPLGGTTPQTAKLSVEATSSASGW